jgi:hypothetical protein
MERRFCVPSRAKHEEITQQTLRSQFSEQTSGRSTASPNSRLRKSDAISPLKAAHFRQQRSRGPLGAIVSASGHDRECDQVELDGLLTFR